MKPKNQKTSKTTQVKKSPLKRALSTYARQFTVFIFVAFFAAIGVALLVGTHADTGRKPIGMYTDWSWNGANAKSLETGIRLEKDPTKVLSQVGYYWANQVWFSSNSTGYMGVQTNGQAGNYYGKIAIFSFFGPAIDVRNGTTGSACTLDKSNSFDGYSGVNGSTCRVPLDWHAGDTYRMRMYQSSSDSGGAWWTAEIVNAANGASQTIGSIRVASNWGLLIGLGNWTEYYSNARPSCDAPGSGIVFLTPKMDGVAPNSHNNHVYNAPNNDCQDVRFTDLPEGVRQETSLNGPGIAVALPAGGVYLSDLQWKSARTDYAQVYKDRLGDGTPIQLNGNTYNKGIALNSNGEVVYTLNKGYTKFVSWGGLNDTCWSGSVTVQVWADSQKLFDSASVPRATPPYPSRIELNVTGKNELRLVVTDAGDGINADCAVFGDARLFPDQSQQVTITNTTPTTTNPSVPTPTNSGSGSDPNVGLSMIMAIQGYKDAAYKNATSMYLPNTHTIDFDWGGGVPLGTGGMQPDWYMIGWQGTFTAPGTGTYTFYSEQDDAFALQFNNSQAPFTIDAWTGPWNGKSTPTAQGTINFTQGQQVPLYAYFTEMTGNARVRLYWSGPGIYGKQIFPNIGSPSAPVPQSTPTQVAPPAQKVCKTALLGICLGY